MLLLKKNIIGLVFFVALVFSASASAGLYGFTETDAEVSAEHLSIPPRHIKNYRKDMRDLVVVLSSYGKSRNHNFQVLTHEGQYLLDKSLWEYHLKAYNKIRQNKEPVEDIAFLTTDIPEIDEERPLEIKRYIDSIDGIAVNNHYCKNMPIDSSIKELNLPIFSIEQCSDEISLDDAIDQSFKDKISIYPFIYPEQAFKKIFHQLIINESSNNILKLKDARNISFLIDDELYSEPYQMIEDIRNSNYDVVVIRPVFHDKIAFSKEDIDSLKFKKNGARRLILSLYNISELSVSDYLWKKEWSRKLPSWLVAKSMSSENAYIAKYWTPEWRRIVEKYYKSIVDTEYDGVFLTGIENHSYFEKNKPLE